ncbi:hypothetical protein [Nocardiopsis sp. TNDT3]|uniref:hypothetical protein n=1 Tax=Nocardiopsis sp. TNDT3 TaxID=2249354 RepID=UPI000E3C57C9|nr:hypothetical protein [Nocardiopsis sp. TNDT3]
MATLPPLVTLEEFGTWVGEELTGNDQAAMVLAAASALVRAEARRTWVGEDGHLAEVPEQVRTITLESAARRWRNPEGYTGETDGDYNYRQDAENASVYLLEPERDILARLRRPRSGLWTLATTRGEIPWRSNYHHVLD